MKQKHKKLDDLKYIPTGNNWKKVLLEIYNHAPHSYSDSPEMSFYDDNHPLAQKLKITGYECGLAISFLRESNLIKENERRAVLTEKGFDVAVKLEDQLSNERTQKVVMIFTAIIAFTGIMAFLADFVPEYKKQLFWIYIIIILLLLSSFFLHGLMEKIKRFIFNRELNKYWKAVKKENE